MNLSDIIKSDLDRLFIVDTECFIIFTGESLNDDRPFIRIGTWYDLPVEIISLVENIIVSDKILGNPSYEQFNIDVRHLESNRYIGSESILKRFLDYQRIFGLDLTNVSIVNIEKDIPELSSQKNISDRDQFIGIFYSDGNIKINHGTKNIFDLNVLFNDNLNREEILDRISAISKNTERYKGSGIVVIDNNPLFYQKGYFSSYQFPDRYLEFFSILQINPNNIRELLLPSQNLINISGFMKFKNQRGGRIKLFSDNSEQIDLIKRLFKNATVSDDKFSVMDINTVEGLKIVSYANSPNIKITFRQSEEKNDGITMPFIKSPADTAKILKEKSDAVLITYTAYEESALLFKSTEVPVIIIDDGNRNIKKISGSDKIVLKAGIQYDIKKFRNFEDLLKEFPGLDELKTAIETSDTEKINDTFGSLRKEPACEDDFYNAIGLVKAYMSNTPDRKKYAVLKEIYQNYSTKTVIQSSAEFRCEKKIILALYNNSCCTVIKQAGVMPAEIFIDNYNETSLNSETLSNDQKNLGERIIKDRERLMKLLSLFYRDKTNSPLFNTIEKEVSLLKKEISARKEIYNNEFYSAAVKDEKRKTKKNIKKDNPLGKNSVFGTALLTKKKIIIPSAVIIVLALLVMLLTSRNRKSDTEKIITENDLQKVENKNVIFTVKRVDENEKELLLKHKVKISETDIYNYANDVAVKNGYNRISYDGLKDKNPHWIFPGNFFIMLDGEKIVVQKGDTLWDLAHAKLEKMNADFYRIIDEIEKIKDDDKNKIINMVAEAEKYTYIKKQIQIIEMYKKKT
jgi:hypothetical protein